MLIFENIRNGSLQENPFAWGMLNDLYTPENANALASSYPHDHYKVVTGSDGEKEYFYEARALIPMGAHEISDRAELSDAWRALAEDFLSIEYRQAMSQLVGFDLSAAPLEVNVFHYGPGASLGPHLDLKTKIVTHVLYFNKSWDINDGGCLTILNSGNPKDVAKIVPPIVGYSAVIVRSDRSWHAVSQVVNDCQWSRRSLTATFYQPESLSTMWPVDEKAALHRNTFKDM
jgi:Rps23 Pro-64 3,4-dihydroxylase Tpa1-like proline 4-hydroxylase